jgi:hypothetical protein
VRHLDRSSKLAARYYPTPSESGSSEMSWFHEYDDLRRGTATSNAVRASRQEMYSSVQDSNPEGYCSGGDMDYWRP